jgi:threonine dehydratase
MPSSPTSEPRLPTVSDVRAAAARLEGCIVSTPLLESPLLNERLGCRLLLKAEMLQRTGSFKFRGALNKLLRLDVAARRRGVVAYSSGNHAQGVAAAARLLGVPATIVIPADAPALKIANTRAYGADVVLYDREKESREAIGEALAAERGLALVKPYDDPDIIAGQGTVGLELAAQARAAGAALDLLLVPCSGGGLVAGCALALSEESSETTIWTAEPAGFDDTARSLATGRRLSNPAATGSMCDGLLAVTPGEITFAVNARLLRGGVVADDVAVARAMKVAFSYFKVVAEPSGAVALAAVLDGALDVAGKTVAVVASGGNVDPATFRDALAMTD